ncbi:MAG TPA: hypothetical protein VGV38_01225, partial [Pyrinomonadaceae bacterium]|nr:hypothetical protein [Pyrinomonadaceae bacterium]
MELKQTEPGPEAEDARQPEEPTPAEEARGADADASNPLPRAVLRRNQFHLLDGEWRFALDAEDRGLRERWYLGHDYERTATWPGSVESHMEAAKEEAKEHADAAHWQDKVVVWYERDFPLPGREGGPPPNLLQLTFGACGYETRVWLNGRALRTIEGEKVHYGEYTSFSYELPEEGLRLFNRLTVRIADTMDAEIPRGKQQSHVYKRGGIWHATHTGGVRSVWLETVERNRLRARVGAASVVEDRLMRFDFTTLVHDPGVYTLRLKVYGRDARPDGAPIAEDDFTLRLTAGQRRHRVVLEVPGARLWAPQEPNLYRLVAQLIDEGGHAAQIET